MIDKAEISQSKLKEECGICPSLLECVSCDALFRKQQSLDHHIEVCHKFTCFICDWQTASKHAYEDHLAGQHFSENHKNLDLGYRCNDNSIVPDFEVPPVKINGHPKYDETTQTGDGNNHVVTQQSQSTNISVDFDNRINESQLPACHLPKCSCPICSKSFKTKRLLSKHMSTHEALNKVTCDVCGATFRHQKSLRVHQNLHKSGGTGNTCELCDKECKTAYYLQLHIASKHEGIKYSCSLCDKVFKWKQNLIKHKHHRHNEDFDNPCEASSKTSPGKDDQDFNDHLNQPNFPCKICGKLFKLGYTRDKHLRNVHQAEKEHICPQCGAMFKARAYLDQHLVQVHTTNIRVKCQQCERDFKTAAILKNHMKIVHAEIKPKFACPSCPRSFISPKDLKRHLKIHTGEKQFKCPQCDKEFSRKDNFGSHLKTHQHNIDRSLLADEKKSLAMKLNEQSVSHSFSRINANIDSKSNPITKDNSLRSSSLATYNNTNLTEPIQVSLPYQDPSSGIVEQISVPSTDSISYSNVSKSQESSSLHCISSSDVSFTADHSSSGPIRRLASTNLQYLLFSVPVCNNP